MRKLKSGDRIRDYVITDRMITGAFAMTYRGVDRNGYPVFVKQFKSPSPTTDWYAAFVEHQVELQGRIGSTAVQNFAISLVDQFEEHLPPHGRVRCFFQVTEFITHGRDLAVLLENADSLGVTWHQRVVWSKVIMGSINQFHHAQIVHTDLKPENLFLIEDPTIKAGHRLKVIDLDSAIFESRRAPWHDNGYVGTPGYFSPEHGSRDTIPSSKSDIFSAGLILYELLGDGHPYASASDEEYRALVTRHSARPPVLRERMARGNDADVIAIIHRMLDPEPARRPSAIEVLRVLNAVAGRQTPPPPPSAGRPHLSQPSNAAPARPVTAPRAPASAPTKLERGEVASARPLAQLRLYGKGAELVINVSTTLCSSLVREVGDPRYWDKVFQVRIEQRDGAWYATPNLDAPNDTCLNHLLLAGPMRLSPNDVISVGRVSKGVFMSPLRVGLGNDQM